MKDGKEIGGGGDRTHANAQSVSLATHTHTHTKALKFVCIFKWYWMMIPNDAKGFQNNLFVLFLVSFIHAMDKTEFT